MLGPYRAPGERPTALSPKEEKKRGSHYYLLWVGAALLFAVSGCLQFMSWLLNQSNVLHLTAALLSLFSVGFHLKLAMYFKRMY